MIVKFQCLHIFYCLDPGFSESVILSEYYKHVFKLWRATLVYAPGSPNLELV